MKDVFVLYGRVKWCDGIFSEWTNEYFGESPVLELFEDFQSAYERFQLYVKEAHQYFFKSPYYMLDTDLVDMARPAEVFADYNMNKDRYSYGDIQWNFCVCENESASWQMYAVNIDTEWCPILAGLYIKKTSFTPDAKKFNS